MERVTAMEEFFERNVVFEATTYIKKYGGGGWRGVGVQRDPENASDRYAVAVKRKELS